MTARSVRGVLQSPGSAWSRPIAGLVLAVLLTSASALGQATWTGTVSTNWDTAGNWSTNAIPSSTTDVTINQLAGPTPNYPSTLNAATPTCRNLTVNAGATLTITLLHDVRADGSVTNSGTISGVGGILMTGTLAATLGAGNYGSVTIQKTGAASVTTSGVVNVATAMVVTSGTLNVNSTLHVLSSGVATFSGGTVSGNSAGLLDCDGNVAWSGATCTTPPSAISCAGNWTADVNFNPGSGTVTFDGAGAAQTISASGANARFSALTIGTVSVTNVGFSSPVLVAGTLSIQGTFSASGAGTLDCNGTATVLNGGAFNTGAASHTFASSLTVSGTIGGTGTFVFDGTSNASVVGAVNPASALKNVTCAKSTTSILTFTSPLTMNGQFTVTSGQVAFGNVTVNGNAAFNGGSVSGGTLTVNGNVNFAGTAATSTLSIDCNGNWTSDSGFAPTGGTVSFIGGGTKTVTGTNVAFANLNITGGTTVNVNVPIAVQVSLTSQGTVNANAVFDVNGSANFSAGTFNAGNFTHTFATSLTIANTTLNATGTFQFDGFSTGSVSSTANLPNVVVVKNGGAGFSMTGTTVIDGVLTLNSGVLTGQTVNVINNHDAIFAGGIYDGSNQMSVSGNVNFSGSLCNQVGSLVVTGNWTANAFFAPVSGLVTFTGSPRQISGTAAKFNDLVINAGATVSTFLPVFVGGTLTVAGFFQVNNALDSNGNVTVTTSGNLQLGSATHSMGASLAVNGQMSSTGPFVFDSASAGTVAGSASQTLQLPSVTVAKFPGVSLTLNGNLAINGSLALTSGVLIVAGTNSVSGTATFTAGQLIDANPVFGSVGTLNVASHVVFNGALSNTPPNITCGGDLTVHPSFSPNIGTVTMNSVVPRQIVGSTARFKNLTIASTSTITTALDVLVRADLTVAGGLTIAGALTVDGNCNVTGGLFPGAAVHRFRTSFIVAAPGGILNASPGASFILEGPNTATFRVNSVWTSPPVAIAKSTNASVSIDAATNVNGGFTLTSGNLTVSQPVTVTGNSAFHGGTASFTALFASGGVTFDGCFCTGTANVQCSGDWNANLGFNPAAGTVTFAGTGTRTVTGSALFFQNVVIQGGTSITTNQDLHIRGDLSVGGFSQLTTTAVLDLDGDLTAAALSTLALGNQTHTFGGSFTTIGFVSAPGGTFVFDGTNNSSSPIPLISSTLSSFPNVIITKVGSIVLNPVATPQAPLVISGTLTVQQGIVSIAALVSVSSNALFNGGLLTGNGTLDVAGNVVFDGTSVSNSPNINCAGNWTAHPNFTGTSGVVTFTGAALQTIIGSSAAFGSVVLAPGASVSTNLDLTVGGSFALSGGASPATPTSFTTTASVNIRGAVTVATNANFALGSSTLHRFGGAFANSGNMTASGRFTFDGTGTVTSTSQLPETVVAGTSVTLSALPLTALNVNGPLSLTAGFLTVAGTLGVTSAGNAVLTGGEIQGTNSLLTVNGDVLVNGTIAQTPPRIICRGNWSSSPTFDPAVGTVELRGTVLTTVSSTVPALPVNFHDLEIHEGLRRFTTPVQATGATILLQSNAALNIASGGSLKCFGVTFTANGNLQIDGGGQLQLDGASSVSVNPSGALRLLGSASALASIDGIGGGGYSFTVSGLLEAQHFIIRRPGANGFVITANALIGTTPLDFRNGTFDFPKNTIGATLLTVTRNNPTTFASLTFQNSNNSVGTFNVTDTTGSFVTMQNATGAFSGPAFESDPNNLVSWTSSTLTTLASFTATPGPNQVTVSWTTIVESGVTSYALERATSIGGPFVLSVNLPTTGVGHTYTRVEPALLPGQQYFWRLNEVIGVTPTVLGTISATPFSAAPPANLLTVSSGGPFTTIQAAVTAATLPNTVIRVSPGTYPSFTVNNPPVGLLKIVGNGGIVNIGTAAGPVTISNVGVNSQVELSDFAIDPLGGSVNTGLLVSNCAGVVVLDEMSVQGAAGQPGVRVTGSPKVAIQRSQLNGTQGLRLEANSIVYASRGGTNSITVTGNSTLTSCQFTSVNAPTIVAGSTHNAVPGLMPDLQMPELSSIGSQVTANVQSFGSSLWLLALQTQFDYLRLEPAVDMVVMINPFSPTFTVMTSAVSDLAGNGSFTFFVTQDGSLLGASFVFQVAAFNIAGGAPRVSNAVSVTLTP